jgi:hypothetical protein
MGAEAAERVSKRLAQRFGLPAAVSWNVEGDDLLQLWAEKQVVDEMKELQKKPKVSTEVGNLTVGP